MKFIAFDEEAFAGVSVWYPHQETEGDRHTAYQANAEAALPNAMARPIHTSVPMQESALQTEVNLAGSRKLLQELSVFRQDVLSEVRQDKADITRKLQEMQEGGLVCEVSYAPLMCTKLAL